MTQKISILDRDRKLIGYIWYDWDGRAETFIKEIVTNGKPSSIRIVRCPFCGEGGE